MLFKTAGTLLFRNSRRIGLNIINDNFKTKSNRFFILSRSIMSGETGAVSKPIEQGGVNLEQIVNVLTDYAPLSLAESWDNVGLLIEPFTKRKIKRIMLTNDLAMTVLEECMDKEMDMIIAYHPPIFTPIKKLSLKKWTEKVIQCCLENRIAVYTPHTTWDSIPGGINDWLASAFDNKKSEPLQPYYTYKPPNHMYSIVIMCKDGYGIGGLEHGLQSLGVNKTYSNSFSAVEEFVGSCKKEALPQVYAYLKSLKNISFEIYNRVPLPEPKTGIGRLVHFKKPITIKQAMDRIKEHTNVNYCRIAYALNCGPDTLVRSAAIVPGSGAKVLENVKADLFVTGEMLHHDILSAIHNNSSVIMTTHSDSERGFLKVFAEFLRQKLNNEVEIFVSERDKDPIELYH